MQDQLDKLYVRSRYRKVIGFRRLT